MLKSITIKNFKAIEELNLKDLASVNYLVGPNGGGKSSVLEMIYIFNFFSYKSFEDIIQIPTESTESTPILVKKFIDIKNDYSNDLQVNFSVLYKGTAIKQNSIIGIDDLEIRLLNNILELEDLNHPPTQSQYFQQFKPGRIRYFGFQENKYPKALSFEFLAKGVVDRNNAESMRNFVKKYNETFNTHIITADEMRLTTQDQVTIEISKLSGGQKQWIDLYLSLDRVCVGLKSDNPGSRSIICLEEPETSFHPELQKTIPSLLENLSIQYNIQFIISTHSPFIISAAAGLPDQKVYMIEGGKCVNPQGSEGYETRAEANILLGAGLEDFHKQIVICEGEGKRPLDEIVYNTIFKKEKYLFISAGGATQLNANSLLSKKVLKSIFASTESIAFYLKDGDGKKSNVQKNESDTSMQQAGYPIKFLKRYAIEMYIYDPEVVKLAFPGCVIDQYTNLYKQWENKIPTKPNINGNPYKFDHAQEVRWFLDTQMSEIKIAELLASKINLQNTPTVYQDLYNVIFG